MLTNEQLETVVNTIDSTPYTYMNQLTAAIKKALSSKGWSSASREVKVKWSGRGVVVLMTKNEKNRYNNAGYFLTRS